jgi:protein gp37
MAAGTKIEWADHTFNPWIGCTKVSAGCDHCYAEADFDKRRGVATWGAGQTRSRTSPANWRWPLRWEKQAQAFQAEHGRRQRVFCASLADVFDNEVPTQWRRDLFDLIEVTPHLDWLLLTKRIGNARSLYGDAYLDSARALPPNVWLGATVVNQAEADRDIPKLLAVPARVRFLSIEPMLGSINLHRIHQQGSLDGGGQWDSWESCITGRRFDIWADQDTEGWPKIDWVICGGESGPNARPMHPDWARSLRDQCQAAGVPFLFKQWGEWMPICQQTDEFCRSLYRSNRVALPHEDQGNLDDIYGRTCRVAQSVIQADGTVLEPLAPMAFRVGLGSVLTFRVGKKAAGRLLDGRTWDETPSSLEKVKHADQAAQQLEER